MRHVTEGTFKENLDSHDFLGVDLKKGHTAIFF